MKTKVATAIAVTLITPVLLSAFGAKGTGAAETYTVDKGHSAVLFRIKHLNVSYFYGRFNDMSGSFTFDAGCSLEVTIKTDSADTNSPKRDRHIKGPDFLNARQFPVMTFKSSQSKEVGTDKYEVTGDLTLHGVTKTITTVVERVGSGPDPWGGHRSGIETTFTIKRSEFGMTGMLKGLGDEIRITVSLEGVRQ